LRKDLQDTFGNLNTVARLIKKRKVLEAKLTKHA
jgi:hypothetical protein